MLALNSGTEKLENEPGPEHNLPGVGTIVLRFERLFWGGSVTKEPNSYKCQPQHFLGTLVFEARVGDRFQRRMGSAEMVEIGASKERKEAKVSQGLVLKGKLVNPSEPRLRFLLVISRPTASFGWSHVRGSGVEGCRPR